MRCRGVHPDFWPAAAGRPWWFLALAAAAVTLAACGGGGGDPEPIPAFDSSGDVVVADVDGDGLDDIAVTVSRIDGPPPHAGSLKLWLQRSDLPGAFRPATAHGVGPDPWRVRMADVDGDAVPDVVVMSSHASAVDGAPLVDVVTVLRGDPVQRGRFLPGATLHAGARLADVALADLDADGLVDIAFTSYNIGARVAVWWNDPAAPGRFAAGAITLAPVAAGAMAAADFDGDGRTDLAFSTGSEVRMLPHDRVAARVFLPPVTIASGSFLTCLLATDLDADGLTDLVLGSRATQDIGAPGQLITWHNDAARPGHFVERQRLALAVHAGDCAAADLNRDAAVDLVSTGAGYGGDLFDDVIEVFMADPARVGSLLPALRTVTNDTTSGYHLAFGRLDGDAVPDAVMPYDGGVLILRQDPARPGAFLRASALR